VLGPVVSNDFGVWPENWPAIQLFLCCATQWRITGGFSGVRWEGIDYPAAESVLRALKVGEWSDLFGSLRIMEKEARAILNGQ
jgi:hypothetical protein